MSFGRNVVNIEKTSRPFATLKTAKDVFRTWKKCGPRFSFGRTEEHAAATSWGWAHTGWEGTRRCEIRYDGEQVGYIDQTEDGWVVRDFYGR
tara:strand:- start:118 stop:393 length:276 start_codon:yes stop_codon:yes gene_type:complete